MTTTFDLLSQQRLERKETSHESLKVPDDVQLSEDLLQKYDCNSRQEWAKNAVEDDEFRNNAQWTAKQADLLEKRRQMPIVVNVIHPAVEQAKALLTTNKPRFSATGREDSDVKVGRLFADLMSYIWDISSGNVELKIAIDDYYVKGMGVLYAYHDPLGDYGNGEVFIKALNPLDVYVDPDSQDPFGRDAAHIMVVRVLSREQIQALQPDYVNLLNRAKQVASTRHPSMNRASLEGQVVDASTAITGDGEYYEVIDRYSKVKITTYRADYPNNLQRIVEQHQVEAFFAEPACYKVSAGGNTWVVDEPGVAECMQLFEQTGGTFHYTMDPATGQPVVIPGDESEDPNAVPGSTVQIIPATKKDAYEAQAFSMTPVITTKILRVLSAGGVRLFSGILPLDEYPIVLIPNRHNRNPFPMSDVRFVRPIQEYINKVRSLILAHTANSTNVKAFIPRGGVNKQELEREWAKAGAALIEYDPEFGAPVIAAPPPLPNELFMNESNARNDIQEILGIYPLMQGDVNQAPETFKGTVALEEYGQRRIRSKKDDIEASLNQLCKVIVQLIQATYTKSKTIRLMEPNFPLKEVSVNQFQYNEFGEVIDIINDVTVGKYDLVVVSGSMLPSNRWARFEYYKELYQLGIIDQIEVLKQTEVADMEGVLNRFSEIQRLQQMVAQLQGQVKELSGDLQTARRESVSDRKRVEVMKFKTDLDSVKNRAEASGQMYEARLKDSLQMQKTVQKNSQKKSSEKK